MFRRFAAIAAVTCLVVAVPMSAAAHEHRTVGPFETTVGWLEEPAFAGFRNAVQFILERPSGEEADAEAAPVEGAELQVTVIFGGPDGEATRGPVELRPAFGTPGEYRAFLIPTRPGTYTFHITGEVGDSEIDEVYTSGEDTFNDIQRPSDVHFPEEDPSAGELAQALNTSEERAIALDDDLDDARTLATAGLAVGGLGVLIAIGATVMAVRARG